MAQSTQSGGFVRAMRRWLGRTAPAATRAAVAAERPAPAGESDPRLTLMLAEWQDVRESMRFCDRQRLIQLALFVLASTVIMAAYLAVAAVAEARWGAARWVLPAFGVIVSAIFLALESGELAVRREWARRGRQIEAAVQVLVPGIAHVSSLALLSQFGSELSRRARLAAAALGVLYGLALAAWAVALLVRLLTQG